MKIKVVKTRDGDLVPFDVSRIERAVEKAAEATGKSNLSFIDTLSADVIEKLTEIAMTEEGQRALTIEEIQDTIENKLMENHYFDIAKQYIIYRNQRRMKRKASKEKVEKKLEKNTLKIIKADGKKELFEIEKVKATYKRINYKLARKCKFEELEESLKNILLKTCKPVISWRWWLNQQ